MAADPGMVEPAATARGYPEPSSGRSATIKVRSVKVVGFVGSFLMFRMTVRFPMSRSGFSDVSASAARVAVAERDISKPSRRPVSDQTACPLRVHGRAVRRDRRQTREVALASARRLGGTDDAFR